jgi:hypothetical protein
VNNNKTIRYTALAGSIGSALFVIVFTVEGWLRADYNALSTYVSALSLGPRRGVQISNFMVSGILMLVFSRGVAIAFRKEKRSQAGPVLLGIVSAGMFLSGPFVMDSMGTLPARASVHGLVHGITGSIVFLLMPISVLVCYRPLRTEPRWHTFSSWTLAMGILLTITLIIFTCATKIPASHIIDSHWFGLLQRMELIPFMFWVFTFAVALYKERQHLPAV